MGPPRKRQFLSSWRLGVLAFQIFPFHPNLALQARLHFETPSRQDAKEDLQRPATGGFRAGQKRWIIMTDGERFERNGVRAEPGREADRVARIVVDSAFSVHKALGPSLGLLINFNAYLIKDGI